MKETSVREDRPKGALSLILVNHNDSIHLRSCLRSLEPEARDLEAQVILVDNNSTDGSQAMIRSSFPWVRLIENSENLGFARANNQGIRESRADFLLFLNPDTVVFPGALSELLDELKRRPQAGAIAPRLVREDGSFQVSFGRRVSFFSELLQRLLFNPYYRVVLRFFSRAREAGWLSGACLLVRRKSLEDAGLFDENFFLYFEDIDLCYRLRKKGFRLILYPRATVLHAGGASTSGQKLASRLEYRHSQVYFYKKHNSRVSCFLLRLYLRLIFFFWGLFAAGSAEERALWREKTMDMFKGRAKVE
ncbi:MAG: glycosyltransferase family 2 protein [Candidatus Aminicenantes bacterium]|nr:glycosyltransferase family 2 protein [Candidatus Aminicenantes bacterium]